MKAEPPNPERRVIAVLGMSAERGTMSLPASDRAAMELATRAASSVEVYSFQPSPEPLWYALAAGASTASVVSELPAADFDLALVGQGGAEPHGDLMVAQIADRRGCPMIVEVVNVRATADGWRVVRALPRGASEVVGVRGPAVLFVAQSAPRQTYVSRSRYHRARRRHPQFANIQGTPSDTSQDDWEVVSMRTKTAGDAARLIGSASDRLDAAFGTSELRGDAPAKRVIEDDPQSCAAHLLRYLRHHGFIEYDTSLVLSEGATAVADSSDAPQTDERREFATAVREVSRRPRPLTPTDQQTAACGRQPRPFANAPGNQDVRQRLARRPRPPGQQQPPHFRGPFPQ